MNIIEINWKWNSKLSSRSKTDKIILHHAAAESCTAYQVDSWHKSNGWSGIGYHFFVTKDGKTYRGRPEWAVGSHASGSNSTSIGICAEGNFDVEKMPENQKQAIKELLKSLKKSYPDVKIIGHKEVNSTGCPGKNYPLDEMKAFFKNAENEVSFVEKKENQNLDKLSELIINHEERINKIERKMIYNYIDKNMPDWAKPTVQKLVEKEILKGNEKGELFLTDEMLRMLVINDRAGLYK